jgi:hypothetical protein
MGSSWPTKREIAETNDAMLRRQQQFRLAAEYAASAFARIPSVERVALFGSVALPLPSEVPRFREYRRAGVAVLHECKDVDIAVWVADLSSIAELRRASSQCVNDVLRETSVGVAHHQLDVSSSNPAAIATWAGSARLAPAQKPSPNASCRAAVRRHSCANTRTSFWKLTLSRQSESFHSTIRGKIPAPEPPHDQRGIPALKWPRRAGKGSQSRVFPLAGTAPGRQVCGKGPDICRASAAERILARLTGSAPDSAAFGNGRMPVGSGRNPRRLRLDKPFRTGAFLPKSGTFRANNAGGRARFH